MCKYEINASVGPCGGEDSLKKRYIVKLFSNIFGLIIGLGTQAIIPRGLGPSAYGNFNYLTNFFQQIFGFLDMGAINCFYTKLSQRQKDFKIISFYFYFLGIISLFVLVFLAAGQAFSIYPVILPDQKLFYIYLAAFWGILTCFSLAIDRMADAYALTVYQEMARVWQKIFGLLLILTLYLSHQLNLTSFFLYNYIIMFFIGVVVFSIFEKNGYSMRRSWRLSFGEVQQYFQEFYQYSRPLFTMGIFCVIINLADRWMLQYFGGSIEQGFYGLSSLIGSICFIFTGAMIPLIWRELSVAYGKKDFEHMSHLFRRYFPLLYSIVAILSCFIAIQADKVIYIMGGHQYSGALWTLVVMAFYPIHQTYGQLTASVCMAAGQTSLYSKIGLASAIVGLPLGYFLVAPAKNMGLNAGATGLAIKMVVMQIIGVNILLYYNCRLLKLNFSRYAGHQILAVFLFLVFSAFAMFVVDRWLVPQHYMLINFLFSGIVYLCMIMGLLYYKPSLFGLDRKDISWVAQLVLQKIRK